MENINYKNLIFDFVKSNTLKGYVEKGDDVFDWHMGELILRFNIGTNETLVEYYHKKCLFSIGHFHENNEGVIDTIKEINDENKVVEIKKFMFGSSFRLVLKTAKRKKNWLFTKYYYSD